MINSIVFLLFTLIALTSCEKDCSSPVVQDNATLLARPKAWKFISSKSVINNNPEEYIRSSVPQDFDNWTFTFNTDGTGVLKSTNESWQLTYNWLNTEKTKLSFVLQQPNLVTGQWDNILLTEDKLSYTEYIATPLRLSMSINNLVPVE